MSSLIVPLQVFAQQDPTLDLTGSASKVGVVRLGAESTSYIPYGPTANNSATGLGFSFPVAENTVLDSTMWLSATVSVSFQATTSGTGNIALISGAPRNLPLHSVTGTSTVAFDGNAVSYFPRQCIQQLAVRSQRALLKDFASTPIHPDTAQTYASVATTPRDCLGFYNNSDLATPQRGAWPTYITYTNINGTPLTGVNLTNPSSVTNNQVIRGVVQFTIWEPIQHPLLNPLKMGGAGIGGIKNFALQLVLDPKLERVWSMAPVTTGFATLGLTTGNIQVSGGDIYSATPVNTFSNAQLWVRALTPSPVGPVTVPRTIDTPYTQIDVYPTEYNGPSIGMAAQPWASAPTTSITSQLFSLASVPDMIAVYVCPSLSAQGAGMASYNLPIRGVSVTIPGVGQALMQAATVADLYKYSRECGSQQSWSDFIGCVQTGLGTQIASMGSVVFLRMGPHVPLGVSLAGGMSGLSTQLQVVVQVINNTAAAFTSGYTLNVVAFTPSQRVSTSDGVTRTQVGLFTSADVAGAKLTDAKLLSYSDVAEGEPSGAGIFDTLSRGLKKAVALAPAVAKVVSAAHQFAADHGVSDARVDQAVAVIKRATGGGMRHLHRR